MDMSLVDWMVLTLDFGTADLKVNLTAEYWVVKTAVYLGVLRAGRRVGLKVLYLVAILAVVTDDLKVNL